MDTASVIVLQARVGSARLPGKSLLPLGGMPLAVLAARRLVNAGASAIVAVPEAPADDPLAEEVAAAGLQLHRGPTEDVRARILGATAGLDDRTAVVRATADNTVPDEAFAAELLAAFDRSRATYLGSNWPSDDMPHGLGLEAFRLGSLRAEAEAAISEGEDPGREHVTSGLRSKQSVPWRPRAAPAGLARLRCTIDVYEDYLRMRKVFAGVHDPIEIGWLELCERLAALDDAPSFRIPSGRVAGARSPSLVLGTAQLGSEYGSIRTTSAPPQAEIDSMVRIAAAHGVSEIDTARAYGSAEARLGVALEGAGEMAITTKLDPLDRVGSEEDDQRIEDAVELSILRSLRDLRAERVAAMLVHRPAHLADERIRAVLGRHHRQGTIGQIGVSVYTPQEAKAALADELVEQLQLPVNVLDRRWDDSGVDRLLAARPDLVVHGRSILLQGVLAGTIPPERWPIDTAEAERIDATLQEAAAQFGRDGIAELCIAWARALAWIDGLVIGIENTPKLRSTLEIFRHPPLTPDDAAELSARIGHVPERLLDPRSWSANPSTVC